jgi:hypothetical protein
MEAHEAMERVERMHGLATFLSNEAVKEVITKETKGADISAQFEVNDVKTTIADANAVLLRVVGTGNPKEAPAVAKAEMLERRIDTEFKPVDARLRTQIVADEADRQRADQRHLLYELSEVGLQVGIVLAGISILARRRWLLGGGALLGAAGIGLLISGLVY